MSYDEEIEERLRRRELRAERAQRYLRKRSELDEVMEEVFDRVTLMTIYDLMNDRLIEDFYGVISSGKESRIYYVRGCDGVELAVKIYLVTSAEFKHNRMAYVVDDPRFKRVPTDFRKFINLWAQREFKNLEEAYEAGVAVPRPRFVRKNVLGMDFLGRDGARYPLLSELEAEQEEFAELYEKTLNVVAALYQKAGLVHGDLSQFNIIIGDGLEVYLIDLAQAVKRGHPIAEPSLIHGLETLARFFAKKGVEVDDLDTMLARVRGGV
ncbi:MAG: serine protein kinase RIO [Aigarchaeota archaeon]|nr:serine protein kinase RIO [Candidatus Pelearchaeum maunauluense]